MKFEKFQTAIKRDVGGNVEIIVNEGRLNQSGLVEARIEVWNGNLLYSNVVLTAKEADREKCKDAVLRKANGAKVKGIKGAEILSFLLDLDATLSNHFTAQANASASSSNTNNSAPYCATTDGLWWRKPTQNGSIAIKLTNFTAEIKADTQEDDGQETKCVFDIEAKLGSRTEQLSIPAAQFSSMRWVIEALGARAIINPGSTDHARCAIQELSKNVRRLHMFTHTGWRKMRKAGNVEWVYIHAGGAIGEKGDVAQVHVKLSSDLADFKLPAPPQGDDLIKAIRASLRILNAAPRIITFPLLAVTYRAPIGGCDFSWFVSGPSGAGKSEIAALAQQHYGAALDARNFPMNWVTTGNANEGIAFTLKDTVAVIDDFCPTGSATDIQRMHRDADRLLRGQGNQAGRKRMRADATIKADKYPRGLIISTGEDVPRGKSLRARMLISEVGPGDVDFDDATTQKQGLLTQSQSDASAGLLVSGMSGFIRWLAPQYETIRKELRNKIAGYRNTAARSGMHKRTPEIVANLALGWGYFLSFAYKSGAITEQEKDEYWREGWHWFGQAALMQSRYQSASDPVQVFLDLVQAAISSGRAHIAHVDGSVPSNAQAWGWWESVNDSGSDWNPKGRRIGWVDEKDLYLEKDAALAEVQALGGQTGEPLSIGGVTLHKRLHERGLLLSTDTGRATLHIRRKLDGATRNVIHLSADVFSAAVSTAKKPDISDIDDANDDKKGDASG